MSEDLLPTECLLAVNGTNQRATQPLRITPALSLRISESDQSAESRRQRGTPYSHLTTLSVHGQDTREA